jgi:putative transposase
MSTRRTSHAVYDAKHHLVWAPKYRKWVLRGDIRKRVGELFREIGDRHDIEIDTLEVAGDHVHLFVLFPPRLSISEVVGALKANSARVVFEEFPEAKREMHGGEPKGKWIFCSNGRGRGDNESDSTLHRVSWA